MSLSVMFTHSCIFFQKVMFLYSILVWDQVDQEKHESKLAVCFSCIAARDQKTGASGYCLQHC